MYSFLLQVLVGFNVLNSALSPLKLKELFVSVFLISSFLVQQMLLLNLKAGVEMSLAQK